jgi:hypothetical protein
MITALFTRLKEKFMSDEKKLTEVERYRKYRAEVEKKFESGEYKPSGEPKEHVSPSGKYKLVTTSYATKPGCWDYKRGQVYAGEKLVADVKRNYASFPFAWAEGHKNGHDYLLCGEDYQGYTVIELDTGRRNDLLPESVPRKYSYKEKDGTVKTGTVPVYPNGYGFCWVGIHPSPDRMVLAIDGCYWACPYEVVLLDFSEPMKFPLWELERWDDAESFDSWETEGKLLLSRTVEVRKSDGKVLYDLPDEEMDKAEADGDVEEKKITKVWEPKMLPASRSAVARKEYERLLKWLEEVGTQSDASEVVRDLMDRPWFAMSDEDREAVRKLSTALAEREDAKQPQTTHVEVRS